MEANYFTILYCFCHTSTWIHHGCTRVPHPELPSHLPPHTIPLGHPSAPAPNILYHASNLDWWFVSHMIIHMFHIPNPPSLLPAHTIPSGLPREPAPSNQYHELNFGNSFHIWYYTCFNAILPNHPTLSLSHRVQKTVLYICVSFAVSHTGLSLPSF